MDEESENYLRRDCEEAVFKQVYCENEYTMNAEWVIAIMTTVYVLATLAICYFNYRSNEATHKQIEELKRQFEEQNRPRIDVFLHFEGTVAYLVIENLGQMTANQVQVRINEEFFQQEVDSQKAVISKKCFQNLNDTEIRLASKQRFYLCLNNGWTIQRYQQIANVCVNYKDDFGKAYPPQNILIDCSKYNFLTFKEDAKDKIEKIAREFKNLNQNLQSIIPQAQTAISRHNEQRCVNCRFRWRIEK